MEDEKLSFFQALNSFILEFEQLDAINYENKQVLYISAAAILGLGFILIDFGTIKAEIRKKSFFEITYNPKKILWVIIVWTISSGFIGWVGLALGVLNSKVQSAAVAGFSWIYILSSLIDKGTKPEDLQELIEEE